MKYLTVCLLLLGLITGTCILSANMVSNAVLETEALLQQAYEDQSPQTVKAASSVWNAHRGLFGMVLYHDEIDTVDTKLAELQEYAASNDHDDFQSTCAAVISLLKQIRQMEWLYYFNIL